MSCDCRSLRGRRLGDAPLAVTVQRPWTCVPGWNDQTQTPTLAQRVKYNLCLATHRAGQLVLDAGHWIWGKLRGLWDGFRTALNNIAAVARRVVQGGLNMLQGILAELKALLQWLDDQAAHALNFLMWTGIAIGGFLLLYKSPDFINAIRGPAKPAPAQVAA